MMQALRLWARSTAGVVKKSSQLHSRRTYSGDRSGWFWDRPAESFREKIWGRKEGVRSEPTDRMSEGTRVNGPGSPTGKYIDTIDPDDPEYIRNLQRPAEVKEDMKQMEGRSRVSVVLNSQAFKEELEAVIQEQIRQGGPASLFALQQISDLLLPQSRGFNSSFARSSPVIPINDIRGVETLGYSKQEKVLRCKLASCYRLVDMFGWTHGIYNHISARVSQEQEQFLVNPFGMMYSEITASTLVKVNIKGDVVDSGSTELGISKAAFNLHSAIHQARPDIRCIIHLHTPAAVAVSATRQGFLPISQEALICGKVSYHDYCGILVDQQERDLLARNMGPFNKIMFLRNHGVAACGETIEEAFHFAFNLMAACETQVKAMSVGVENLNLVDEETQEKTFKVASEGGGGVDTSGRKWRCGELEFEALMRTLDNAGYRTGHVYKQPLMKQEKKERINSDVEVPPASSSFTYIFDGDYEHSKYISPIKLAMERQKQAYKAGWLTSPNAYKKQEIEEIGTTTPKKITKWVQGGETPEQRSTAVRVDNPNQFAPQGNNPKEFKQKQKSIKKDYYEEKVTAGPQSRILDGISEWDEARTQDGDKTVVVGAASKGIIQRDHQHNVGVYRSYYAANPFENMTEEEIDAYKQGLERQEGGEEAEDVVGPEGRLISSEERRQNIQQSQEDVQEDTEATTAQHMPPDNLVSEEPVVRQEERTPPPVSPKAPSLEDLGLSGLVDTLLQAAINAALSSALSGSQPSQEPGRPCENPIPFSSQLSPVSSPAPVQNTAGSGAGSCGEMVKASAQKVEVPVSESCGEMVKASAQKIEVPVSESDLSEAPQIMTVQLQPTKLFQGKAGDGMMKISFSIQSKVTRRKGKGPKSSWPVENVTIMQTQPKVMMIQPAESHPPKVLQEQQNVVPIPCLQEGQAISVPLSPSCREKHYKRNAQPSSKRQGSSKLSKPRKRFSRWSRRGLTHPLSPVKEEFWDGDDTLEALLAQQNVQLDSDESLEDLLLMTDDYKENLGPKPQSDKSQAAASSTLINKAAPIATVEDLDESGCPSPAPVQSEKQEEPLLVMNQVTGNHSSPSDYGQSNYSHVRPDPGPPEQQPHTGDKTDKTGGEVLESRTKAIDTEDDIKFADEEMSSTFPEASDGDIAPRKQEGSVESLVQLQSAAESTDHLSKEATEGTKKVLPVSAAYKAEECVEKEDARQEGEDQKESVTPSTEQTDQTEHETGITEMKYVRTEISETCTSPQNTESEPEVASIPKLSPDPVISAPLAVQEEDFSDAASISACPSEEEKTKTSLFRTDSACLENSPIVSSPPFDAFPPEPIYRELHRVRSLEDELDDSSSVQRRLNRGHPAVRRVQSAYDTLPNKNRNVAVIDAVLHTVTIDPAKVVQSGQSVAKYLAGPADQTSASDDQKKKWTLMDSVSKSLEALDVEDLAKDGSMIYGRSLEVLIQDGNASENSTQMSMPSQTKSQSLENVLESSTGKEKSTQRGTRLYKDDVVVITKKTPMDFSAISPQVRKDLVEEEGPLVTSSPKLGRRKEGSFKKYQSKMGKSEETLLEVAPLSPERTHQTAKRSKSFPKNYGLKKNRSREGLLDDSPSLQKSDKERELRSSSQSVDEVSERNRRRARPRRARNSDPVFSYSTKDSMSQSDPKKTYSFGKGQTEEVFTRGTLSPARSAHSMDWDETHREDKEESRRRRRRHQSPEGGREQVRRRRRRERSEDNVETADARVDDYPARTQSLGRDRRRRRERSEDNMETADSRVDDYPAQTQSLGRDRRKKRERSEDNNTETADSRVDRRRRERSEDNVETRDSRVDDYPAQTQSLGRDRRKRRERSEDNMETADKRVEDYPAQTQSLERDRRRQQRRDIEETENTQITEAQGREQEKKNSETPIKEGTKPIPVTKKEEQAGEGIPFIPVPHSEFQDEDFPPPPDNLHDNENQQEVVDDIDLITTQQEEDQQLPAYPSRAEKEEDEGEENQPPRVQKPRQPQSTETELTSADISTPKMDVNMEENEVQRRKHKGKPETNPSAEETPFMSTFKQPVRNSQTLGEDFPSLSAKSDLVHSAAGNLEETDIDNDKATNDNKTGSLSTHIESEGTVPIAGNLDILDYNEEANQENEQPQPSPTEEERSKASRARRRAERRQRGRSDSDKEKGRTSTGGRRGSRDSLISGESKVSSSRSSLNRQDSYDSKEPKERLGRRSSRDSDQSKYLKENRVSRDSLTSKDLKNTRDSRDSLARRESQQSEIGALDIMNLDQEPPRAQRDRQERESTSRRNLSQGETEADNSEKPRSEGRLRGRRSGHGYPQNDRPRRSGRIYEEESQDIPLIKVQTASRETLDREDFAPPLPPKQHRSRERLTELDREPRRSRSREMLDAPDSQSAPPELPPKKNRKSLSCVSGQGTEKDDLPKKERKSKERSSSKDRKKMPPPPAPPVAEDYYSEEPRRRRRRHDSNNLIVPGDSFHRESSFDNSFDRNQNVSRSQKPRETGGTSYYGDTEDELKKMVEEEATVSPPQTPRPARKISTSSYGSVSARIARSVSFDDGYTPTMSHAPRHSKSRESLGSEASYHSTSYRPRSYSGASETSVASNPLNYEPWRAKAAAQRPHTRPSSSRSRRPHSQGEPTYSANAGRRRRSRTPSASDSNRLYQPRRTRSRTSLPDSPTRSSAPSGHSKSRETSLIADDSFSDAYSHGYASEAMRPVPAPRSEPERRSQKNRQREGDGDKPGYIMDSASGGETLEERSSKEGSPTKEAPSPTKEKKKKKKFHMPSFSKKKKDSKESTL